MSFCFLERIPIFLKQIIFSSVTYDTPQKNLYYCFVNLTKIIVFKLPFDLHPVIMYNKARNSWKINDDSEDRIMYTVLLTDDEQAVLDSLISVVSWAQLGVDTLLTATDGVQALEILNTTHVDLLITDIRMPHMDGLELLTKVHIQYPAIHCILLTAYSEFEYARSALQLGVENYLLKPFQQDELEHTIEKALDNLYASRKNTSLLFRENILIRWVNANINSEELGQRASLLDLNIYLNTYCVICMSKRVKNCSVSAYCSICFEKLNAKYDVYSFWDDKDRYISIIGSNEFDLNVLINIFSDPIRNAQYQNAFLIAFGTIVKNCDDVWQSYRSACRLLGTYDDNTAGSSCLLTQDSIQDQDHSLLISKIHTLFREDDADKREDGYQEFIRSLALQEKDYTKLFFQLTQSLFQLFEQEFPNRPGIQKQIYSRIHLFTATPAHKEISIAVTELLEYSYLTFRYYFEQLSPIIQSAIGYIHKHYGDGLSIKEFCTKSKTNTVYLGYLFKKETGMFFNNYLTQYRICCALPLLLETDKQINDIAKEVGFGSTSYFITTFNKQVGLSPIKYRTIKMQI